MYITIFVLQEHINNTIFKTGLYLKVRKSQKQFMVSSIIPKKNENHYPEHFPLERDSQHTANILLVKKATFPCLLFPVYFQCIFST